MACARLWCRDLLMKHPALLPRLLETVAGLRPPGAVSAVPLETGQEVLLRAQGGRVPWYLLGVQLRPEPAQVLRWPRLWLDARDAEREPGWLVVLTDSAQVMEWLESGAFTPRFGVATRPLALDLSRHTEALRRHGEPLLTALSLWSARGRPLEGLRPVLRQLVDELVAADDALLAVPVLQGLLLLRPDLRLCLPGLHRHVVAGAGRCPRWWGAATQDQRTDHSPSSAT